MVVCINPGTTLMREVVEAWLNGDETACPHCGNKYNLSRVEEDDGYGYDGHWSIWTWKCHECDRRWLVEYRLEPVNVAEEPKL